MQTENLYTTNCIRTFTGKYINPMDPDPEMLDIIDIAHALAQEPRFGGHLPRPHNVASHCINCCAVGTAKNQFDLLMHDAAEAYFKDMPKPIKDQLPEYKRAEKHMQSIIAKKFGFSYPIPADVKDIDERILESEWRQLMLLEPQRSNEAPMRSYKFDEAKEIFLQLFHKLNPGN